MAKATIINVTVDTAINTAYVTYSTGSEKMYPANKTPKTVQAWLTEYDERQKKEEAFMACERHEDVTTYSEWGGKEVALTEKELEWFHEIVNKCKAATGCTCPITAFNGDFYHGSSKDALGTCHTNNPDNPMEGNSYITIDTFFIHEKYMETFEHFPTIEPESLVNTICHEIAHLTVWSHGEEHDKKTQELVAMVEAYDNDVTEETVIQPAQLPAVIVQTAEVIADQDDRILLRWFLPTIPYMFLWWFVMYAWAGVTVIGKVFGLVESVRPHIADDIRFVRVWWRQSAGFRAELIHEYRLADWEVA